MAPVLETSRVKQAFVFSRGNSAIASHLFATIGCAGSLWLSLAISAIASPVTLDGSTNSAVLDAATNLPSDCSLSCVIRGSDQAGGNLYHSFSEFDVLSGVTVTLDGQGLERILMRVTGGNPSQIDGLLQVQGETDLFLLNPAGLIMGADGRLDIRGSFIGSTAEAVLFENGDVFTTPDDSSPLLSLSVPSGLQFASNTTGTFAIQGDANQSPLWQSSTIGQTFALVIDSSTPATFVQRSHAVTAGGLVLANVGDGFQRVDLTQTVAGWDFDFSDVAEVRGIQLERAEISTASASPGGLVMLDGEVTLTDSEVLLRSQGGIAAGEFQFRGASLTLDRSRLVTQTDAGGGDIHLAMEVENQELILRNSSEIETSSTLGPAGDIRFEGGLVNLSNSSITTDSQDGGGNISLIARDAIALRNNSLLSVQSNDSGTVGNITLEALGSEGFRLNDSQILSTVEIEGGNISILAPRQLSFTRGELITTTQLAGANVSLVTDGVLRLNDSDLISLNSGNGLYAGTGGNLVIEASQVDSVGRDTDIKVVGPLGNLSPDISIHPEFYEGFADFGNVIRGNQRSEIQVTELASLPAPVAPPVPEQLPVPMPEPPTSELVTFEPPMAEAPIAEAPIAEVPELPAPIALPPMSLPVADIVDLPVAQEDGDSEEGSPFVFLPVLLGGNPEDSGETALSARVSDAAYPARRPGCEVAISNLGQLRMVARGGLPARPESFMTLGQSLADLGRSGVTLGRSMDGNLLGEWQRQVGNNAIEMGNQSGLREAEGWQTTASGQVQLLAGVQAPAMEAVKLCRIIPVEAWVSISGGS